MQKMPKKGTGKHEPVNDLRQLIRLALIEYLAKE